MVQNKKNKKNLSLHTIAILGTLIFFLLNLILVLHHEPWRDEANPWQMAKVLSFGNFLEVMHVEPHPPLWFLILSPFAKLGFPYITTNFISLSITSLAVFIFLKKSPFKTPTKLLCVLSAGFFYLNPVISRNYSLVALAVSVLIAIYPNRHKHPLKYILALTLLSQSHFLAGGFVAILAVGFFLETLKAKNYKKILPLFGILVLSLITMLPAAVGSLANHDIIAENVTVSYTYFSNGFNQNLFGTSLPLAEISLVLLLFYLLMRFPKLFIYALAGFGFFFFTLIFIYNTGSIPPQKASLVILFMFLLLSFSHLESPRQNTIFDRIINKVEILKLIYFFIPFRLLIIVPAFLTIPHTISLALDDLTGPYSNSYAVSGYLNTELPDDAIILTASDLTSGLAITYVPLLKGGRQIYDLTTNQTMVYVAYDAEDHSIDDATLNAYLEQTDADHIYLLARQNSYGDTEPITIQQGWRFLTTFVRGNSASETSLQLYEVRNTGFTTIIETDENHTPAFSVSSTEILSDLTVSSIPAMNITTEKTLDLTKGVWNDGMTVSISDSSSPSNNLRNTSAKIKTRGSSTYHAAISYNAPCPYKLKFDEKQDLFGFGASKKYVLLPNFIDPTSIRQFFFFHVAGMFLPESALFARYVELYINGEYKGLYLLAESIEADRLGLSTDDETDFIVELEMQKQNPQIYAATTRLDNAFSITQTTLVSPRKRFNYQETAHLAFELSFPDSFSTISLRYGNHIVSTVQNFYNALEQHKPLDELRIDLDSFIQYFLFKELFYDQGYGRSSIYYFYKDGTLHAGPLWDFDCYGSNWNTVDFLNEEKFRNEVYHTLLTYPEFRTKIQNAFLDFYTLAPTLRQALLNLKSNQTFKTAYEKNEKLTHRLNREDILIEDFTNNPNIESRKTFEEQVDYFIGFFFDGFTGLSFWDEDPIEIEFPARIEWIKNHLNAWR